MVYYLEIVLNREQKDISILTLPLTFTLKFHESIVLSGPRFPTLYSEVV